MSIEDLRPRWQLYASHLGSYMRRWIARCPWGTIRLHNIMRSDEGRDVHDHPFSFISLIIKGGYVEHRPGCRCLTYDGRDPERYLGRTVPNGGPCRFYGPGSIVQRQAKDFHRLELVDGPAWTLVVTGPYWRQWGFQTADGWVDADSYHRRYRR